MRRRARLKSARFVSSICHPGESCDPVHLPGLAAILRERLFKAEGLRGDVRKNKSHLDGSAVELFLVVELAAAIREPADHGLARCALAAVGPMDVPLVVLGIVETRRRTFEVP